MTKLRKERFSKNLAHSQSKMKKGPKSKIKLRNCPQAACQKGKIEKLSPELSKASKSNPKKMKRGKRRKEGCHVSNSMEGKATSS